MMRNTLLCVCVCVCVCLVGCSDPNQSNNQSGDDLRYAIRDVTFDQAIDDTGSFTFTYVMGNSFNGLTKGAEALGLRVVVVIEPTFVVNTSGPAQVVRDAMAGWKYSATIVTISGRDYFIVNKYVNGVYYYSQGGYISVSYY